MVVVVTTIHYLIGGTKRKHCLQGLEESTQILFLKRTVIITTNHFLTSFQVLALFEISLTKKR